MFEIQRKLFHLIGLVYVAGVLYLPRRIFILSVAGALIIDLLVEGARLQNTNFKNLFFRDLEPLMRDSEKKNLTGVFWMMLGILCAAIMTPDRNVLIAILLFLMLGDSAASLIGQRVAGPKWPGSQKSVAGSLAYLVVCMAVGVWLLRPIYSLPEIFCVAAASTFFEYGFMRLNDNFLIPAGTALLLLIIR